MTSNRLARALARALASALVSWLASTLASVLAIGFASAVVATLALTLCLAPEPAHALDRDIRIDQLLHTEWSTRQGAPSDVWSIAQTSDGWLWFGGPTGLHRFDGIRFERVDLTMTAPDRSQAVSALFATTSGGLMIGFARGGVAVWREGALRDDRANPAMGSATVYSMSQDADGALWVATRDRLLRFDGDRWERIGPAWGYAGGAASNVSLDASGTLWVAAGEHILSLARGSRRFITRLDTAPAITEFIASPDGRLWTSSERALQLLPDQRPIAPAGRCASNTKTSFVSLFDRDGAFWALTDTGIGRMAHPDRRANPTHVDTPDVRAKVEESFAMFGTKSMMEDCEGNLWISTASGIHRLRESNVKTLPVQGGQPRVGTFAAAADGAVWIAARSSSYGLGEGDGLWRFKAGMERIQPADLPSAQAVCQAREGGAWVAGRDRMWRQDGDRFNRDLAFPDASTNHFVVAMACASDGGPWVSFDEHGLYRQTGTGWLRNGGIDALPQVGPLAIDIDGAGQLWLGYGNGSVQVVSDGRVVSVARAGDLRVGPVGAVHAGRHVLVGGELGLALLSGGRTLRLESAVADAFRGITGITETDDGDVWINALGGALHITSESLERAVTNASTPVATDVFSVFDGYPGDSNGSAAIGGMARASDGRIWLTGVGGIAWIDPSRIRRNDVAPRVVMRTLSTDSATFEPAPSLSLVAGTRALHIAYTALGYTQPERQQFRYRLSGVDEHWVEAGMRREAFYTNLGPGRYRFEVLAANENGLWSPEPARLDFMIAPTFIQTGLFLGLCILAAFALVVLLIQARVRQLTSRARSRLEARLHERERIARELHDTLLQDTLGFVLKVRAAAARLPTAEPARNLLDSALAGANQILSEGRDRIQDLRSPGAAQENLPNALAHAGAELAETATASCRVTVEGTVRALMPGVAVEVYRIGREALGNAFRHSNASAVEAQFIYGDDEFSLRVRDDGQGIDVGTLEADSTPGHWGLTGMRERAGLIGARLDIWSRDGAGTEIELRVPARLAYPPRRGQLWRLRVVRALRI